MRTYRKTCFDPVRHVFISPSAALAAIVFGASAIGLLVDLLIQ
jgi:hypothetical protein